MLKTYIKSRKSADFCSKKIYLNPLMDCNPLGQRSGIQKTKQNKNPQKITKKISIFNSTQNLDHTAAGQVGEPFFASLKTTTELSVSFKLSH